MSRQLCQTAQEPECSVLIERVLSIYAKCWDLATKTCQSFNYSRYELVFPIHDFIMNKPSEAIQPSQNASNKISYNLNKSS